MNHPLEVALNAPANDILDAISKGFRAQADVKGKLAEYFLEKELSRLKDKGVAPSRQLNRTGWRVCFRGRVRYVSPGFFQREELLREF